MRSSGVSSARLSRFEEECRSAQAQRDALQERFEAALWRESGPACGEPERSVEGAGDARSAAARLAPRRHPRRPTVDYARTYVGKQAQGDKRPVHERNLLQPGRDPPPLCSSTSCERQESAGSVRYAGTASARRRRHELDAVNGSSWRRQRSHCACPS
jgi:hypothetical protein